jgi:hypothetical protein
MIYIITKKKKAVRFINNNRTRNQELSKNNNNNNKTSNSPSEYDIKRVLSRSGYYNKIRNVEGDLNPINYPQFKEVIQLPHPMLRKIKSLNKNPDPINKRYLQIFGRNLTDKEKQIAKNLSEKPQQKINPKLFNPPKEKQSFVNTVRNFFRLPPKTKKNHK